MPLKNNIEDREYDKFGLNSKGQTAVRVIPDVESIEVSNRETIFNLEIANANEEVEIVLPQSCNSYALKSRTVVRLRMAFESGGTDETYFTIPLGGWYKDEKKTLDKSIFLQSDKPCIIELIAYK